ncbi:MAG TPA: diguanylate cyclase [Candidatus Binatus sp.]|jgi:two-component system cell cycle response regulator|nr:diguanylate cyclase [Candidatus Binatus sp.]
MAAQDRLKVLVADDSVVYRKLVEQAFTDANYSLLVARSGQEAIDLLGLHIPAIVITDWMMPDLTGIELCQHIRARSQTPYTYVIILTSVSEKENVVKGLAAGADDYLTKPFHPEELLARVEVGRRLVELHRQVEAKNRLLEELALTDSLTGLPNRRAIDEWAPRQLSGASRHGFPFWVVMADLDNFKSVNDSSGHDAGDKVLKRFADILKTNSRRSNICGRIGGEEFLFILTHADKENVVSVVERVRKQFEEQDFFFGNRVVKVTASFGISGFQGEQGVLPPDFSSLLSQADLALYTAKHRGRNRVEFAPE